MDVNTPSDIPPWEWPDDAGETLLRALRGDAAAEEERLLTIELASSITVMNDEIAEAASEALGMATGWEDFEDDLDEDEW